MIPPVARRFVAGETPAQAFEHARRTNEDGVKVIFNLLGEHYAERELADEDTAAYVRLVEDIGSTDLEACISIKPSQIGLGAGEDVFRENYREIVEVAADSDVMVWCDMEDSMTTDATIDAFEELAEEYEWQVGLCVQANLRRTRADLDRLVDVPGKIRLVKGAYDEDKDIAYTHKEEVNEAYREDMLFLFKERDRGIAVGSHDPKMLSYAMDLHDREGGAFEIQMLMGVREETQRRLAADGYEVWQYAPYGGKWLSYFYRRVRERRQNLLFALRAVAGV